MFFSIKAEKSSLIFFNLNNEITQQLQKVNFTTF
jgi:hypothetical protein